MKIKVAIIALSIFSASQYEAQESVTVVEDVILFQSEAHLVRMTDKGKILAFLKDVDNSYAALNSITPQEIVMNAVEVANAVDLGRSEKSLVLPSKDAYAESDQKLDVKVVDEEETIMNDGMAIAEDTGRPDEEIAARGEEENGEDVAKTTNYDYEFAFDHRDASLSPAVVNQLSQIAEILKADDSVNAEIKSYYSETVDVSKVLSKNRAKGIQDQLVAQGIDRNRIRISETNNEDWANNRVKLSIY